MSERLREVTIGDVVSALPTVEPLATDASNARQLDLWIATLGFEDRCSAVGDALAREGARAKHVLICRYETNPTDNEVNADALLECARRLDHEPDWLDADQPNFAEALRQRLRELHEAASRPLRVAWDISVASNELVVNIASVLLDMNCELEVMYAEAAIYYPTREEFAADSERWREDETMGLDRGTLNMRVSSEHPGEHASQLPDHLMLIPGYSRDRVRRVISKVGMLSDLPHASINWLIGRPHVDADAWRRDALITIHDIPPEHDRTELSTFSYGETMIELERVYARVGLSHNITLCPMGSKLQALGCALFGRARPGVRIMFAQPEQYNAQHYTKGVRALWRIAFGSQVDIAARLANVGTLERTGYGPPEFAEEDESPVEQNQAT